MLSSHPNMLYSIKYAIIAHDTKIWAQITFKLLTKVYRDNKQETV